MKSFRLWILAALTFAGTTVFAQQSKTDSIKVSGNCGMCKKRIETALKVPGVNSANWDVKTKMLTVDYNEASLSLNDLQKKIADAGHDTPKFKANDEAYAKLQSCCQYDRKDSSDKQPKTDHKH